MANHDKIYLSYIGELGKTSQDDSRKRLEWILDNIDSNQKVLDLGCSQGIVSILAAQKGNDVLGIDIEDEAVEFAKDILNNKYTDVRENVKFICADYFKYKIDEKFDVIIMTEVLEHLENPRGFIKKSVENIKENGKAVITVPFGINDHPDHKTTFYYVNFLNLVKEFYNVEDVAFMGRWIGIVASPTGKCIDIYSEKMLKKLEDNFYTIDRKMTDRINELYKNNMAASSKYKEAMETYASLKDKYSSLELGYKQLKENEVKSAQKYRTVTENYSGLKSKNEELQARNLELKTKVDEAAEKYRTVTENYNNLKLKNEEINNKYQTLSEDYTGLKTEHGKLVDKCHEINSLYGKKLEEEYKSNADEIKMLNELKGVIKKLETQNNYLKSENAEYQRKMQLIKDTFIGKILVWGYHKYKNLKTKFVK
mgnify:CR=1 FL=1